MKLFVSWSGDKSRIVAEKLRQWIPDVMQAVEPWMSAVDIDAGARWSNEIQSKLEETKFGIICLTKENLNSPWILFETGALAKTICGTYVCPYLIDLAPSDIPQGPLTQFQAKRSNEKETWELICTINKALPANQTRTEDQLKRAFQLWWQDLQDSLNSLPTEQTESGEKRPMQDMVEEILDIVRMIIRHDKESYIEQILQTVKSIERREKQFFYQIPTSPSSSGSPSSIPSLAGMTEPVSLVAKVIERGKLKVK